MAYLYFLAIDMWKRLFTPSPRCIDLRRPLLQINREERRKARGGR